MSVWWYRNRGGSRVAPTRASSIPSRTRAGRLTRPSGHSRTERKVAISQVIDYHSRLALASLVASGETSAAAITVVALAIERHGVPQKFLSDNGAAVNPTRLAKPVRWSNFSRPRACSQSPANPTNPPSRGRTNASTRPSTNAGTGTAGTGRGRRCGTPQHPTACQPPGLRDRPGNPFPDGQRTHR